jgi:PIN domain nuclease of toxin-antitoxin system
VRLLLDTVAFIWAARAPDLLSKKATAALEDDQAMLEISALSISEVAIKHAKGKLNFGKEAVLVALDDLKLRVLPYTADHALHLFTLPLHHSDPFDRQIIAQASVENIQVVTSDKAFRLYKEVKVLW